MQMQPLLTISEACQALNISYPTMHRYLKDKKIAAAKIGNKWQFKKESIEEYIESRTMKIKKHHA